MFGGTLTLMGKRTADGSSINKYKGRWGLSLVDVIFMDYFESSSDALKSQKQVWSQISSFKRTAKLLATSFHQQSLAPVFVMEFAKCSLKQFYSEDVNPFVISRHIIQIAEAIDYLHDSNIVHRNLHPGSISVMMDENIKLSDFRTAARLGNMQTTIAEDSFGWEEYKDFAANSNSKFGKSNDLFALGCIYFEMLTKKSFMLFPQKVVGNRPKNEFYAHVLHNKGLHSSESQLADLVDGRSTRLEKRLLELHDSAIRGFQIVQIEFIQSLVFESGNQTTSTNILVGTVFHSHLIHNYDTNDSQKWTPDSILTSKHNSTLVCCKQGSENVKCPEDLLEFEQIFECPESVKLEAETTNMETADLNPNNDKKNSVLNTSFREPIAHGSKSTYLQTANYQSRFETNGLIGASASNSERRLQLQAPNSKELQLLTPPNADPNSTAHHRGIGLAIMPPQNIVSEPDDVENITAAGISGNPSQTMTFSPVLGDKPGCTYINLVFDKGNILSSDQAVIQPSNVEILGTYQGNANLLPGTQHATNIAQGGDEVDNIPENDGPDDGPSQRNVMPSDNLTPINLPSTSSTRNVRATTRMNSENTTSQCQTPKRRSSGTKAIQSAKKRGRPKGSYGSYPEIEILISGGFRCINCDVVFQNRTKSLSHRRYYIKKHRCKDA